VNDTRVGEYKSVSVTQSQGGQPHETLSSIHQVLRMPPEPITVSLSSQVNLILGKERDR